MGKAQYKKRIRSVRHHANEISKAPAAPHPDGTTDISSKVKNKKPKNNQKEREATIAVLDKVSSPASHDRIWSLAAISNLVLSSTSTRQLLLSKNLIRLLINRLTEDEDQEEVLIEVTGVLRNLVIEGGRDVCGEMVNKGIIPPLGGLVSKLLASIINFQESVGNGNSADNPAVQSLTWNRLILISENVIIILWSLAETSQKWLDSVCSIQDIVPLLSSILQLFTSRLQSDETKNSIPSHLNVSSSCALATGQCLFALTEDQSKSEIESTCRNDALLEALMSLFVSCELDLKNHSREDSENIELLQVVSIGILRNLLSNAAEPQQELPLKAVFDGKMLRFLMGKLRVDLAELATSAAEANGAVPAISLSDYDIAKASTQEPSQAELKLESIERRLTTVQLSLELLCEWCASADGFDGDGASSDAGASAGEPIEHEEMNDVSNSNEASDDDQGNLSETDDVSMEDIPSSQQPLASNKANGVKFDQCQNEESSNAMDIEEPEPFVQPPHLDRFFDLLIRLPSLAKPTVYLYQSQESGAVSNNTIPTAVNSNGVTSATSAGTVPGLINELLSGIHLRATDTLNNIIITIDRLEGNPKRFVNQIASTHQEAIQLAWKSCFSTADELVQHAHLHRKGKQKALNGSFPSLVFSREQLLISTLTCIWSFSRVFLDPRTSPQVLDVLSHHIKFLTEILRTSEDDIVKARTLSVLICFASRPNVSAEENLLIGQILMEIISDTNKPNINISNSLFIAALDGIFDIYADETRDYDEPVFQQRKFLANLQAAVPTIQGIVKKIDKRKDPTLRRQAEDARNNLLAFIEYRKNLK